MVFGDCWSVNCASRGYFVIFFTSGVECENVFFASDFLMCKSEIWNVNLKASCLKV